MGFTKTLRNFFFPYLTLLIQIHRSRFGITQKCGLQSLAGHYVALETNSRGRRSQSSRAAIDTEMASSICDLLAQLNSASVLA